MQQMSHKNDNKSHVSTFLKQNGSIGIIYQNPQIEEHFKLYATKLASRHVLKKLGTLKKTDSGSK